jgi:glycerol kinase
LTTGYLLGIDQGTSGTKAVLFDAQLRLVDQAYRGLRIQHPHAGWVEQDPDELVGSIAETVLRVLPKEGEVIAAGLDNQGETIVAWDRDSGKALAPAIVWQDKRSTDIVARLDASPAGKGIIKRSRLPLDPYFSSSKFRWLLENNAAVQAAEQRGTLVLGTSDVWLRHRLGARASTDPSTASRTQLIALDTAMFDDVLVRAFGLPEKAMPAIQPTVGELGEVSHPSWPGRIPLRASLVDQQAALAGHACFMHGQIKATYGTGVFVLTNAGSALPSVSGLLPTIAWQLDSTLTYALDGGVLAAGTVIDWLGEQLNLFANPAQTAAMAVSVRDSGGVQFLPAFAGLGAPWWRPGMTGSITGLRSSTSSAHLVRAALEGIAQSVADIVDRVRKRFDVPSISVDGGLTKNTFLVQFQADLLGIPLMRPATTEATALGAAALAALGAGIVPDLASLARMLQPPQSVQPQRSSAWRKQERTAWRSFIKSELARQNRSEPELV